MVDSSLFVLVLIAFTAAAKIDGKLKTFNETEPINFQVKYPYTSILLAFWTCNLDTSIDFTFEGLNRLTPITSFIAKANAWHFINISRKHQKVTVRPGYEGRVWTGKAFNKTHTVQMRIESDKEVYWKQCIDLYDKYCYLEAVDCRRYPKPKTVGMTTVVVLIVIICVLVVMLIGISFYVIKRKKSFAKAAESEVGKANGYENIEMVETGSSSLKRKGSHESINDLCGAATEKEEEAVV